MAEAEKTRRVISTVTETVTLHLSVKEAETLMAVIGRVSGSLDNSPRKHVSSIYNALRSADVLNGVSIGAGLHHALSLLGTVATGGPLCGFAFEDYPADWSESDRG